MTVLILDGSADSLVRKSLGLWRRFGWVGFLEGPLMVVIGLAMAVGGKEPMPMPPEPGPDAFAVGGRQLERGKG